MRTIFRIIQGDIRRITGSVASIIVVIGLTVIPGLFSWFNIAASWDPFSNTSHLTFAVANTDACYESDLIPTRVCVGDQITNALRANSQLDWTFTTQSDAIDGTKSGKYYAAVVIPADFSKDMMTFFSSDMHHAKLKYYTNEKLNALAHKVTGQGADQVSTQINTMFSSTITSVALRLASKIADTLESPEASKALAQFQGNLNTFADQLNATATTLGTYMQLTDAASQLLSSSAQLIASTTGEAKNVSSNIDTAKKGVEQSSNALQTSLNALTSALDTSAESYKTVADNVDKTFDNASKTSKDTSAALRTQAQQVDAQANPYRQIRASLQELLDNSKSEDGMNTIGGSISGPNGSASVEFGENIGIIPATLQALINRMDHIISRIEAVRDSLNNAASKLEQGNSDIASSRKEIADLAQQAQNAIQGASNNFTTTLKPQLDLISNDLQSMQGAVSQANGSIESLLSTVNTGTNDAKDGLAQLHTSLDKASQKLTNSANEIKDFAAKLGTALTTGSIDDLKVLLESNPDSLAATLAAPVALQRTALFPVKNFGASLTPFYTFLPLWVGSLLLCVTLKVTLSPKVLESLGLAAARDKRRRALRHAHKAKSAGLSHAAKTTGSVANATVDSNADAATVVIDPIDVPTIPLWQQYFGHYGIFALLSLLQSTCSCAGTLLFLKVSVEYPWLFMLSGWVSGLVYSLLVYSFVYCFGNIGKAIGVILLVMQISASGGAYPLEVLPSFVSAVNPFLPATHSVGMMRAAISGIYASDYWVQMGQLLLFVLPVVLFAVLLGKPLAAYNRWYEKHVEEAKVIA